MSARTRYYVKALVPTERWFVVSAVTGEEAVEELRKEETVLFVVKTTCDPSPEEKLELQNFLL